MNLEVFRARAAIALAIMGTIIALAVAVVEIVREGGPGIGTALAVAALVFLVAGFALFRDQPAFRYLAVSVLMAQVMAGLIVMRGTPVQSDIHMAFFAALAMCALLYDSRAIALGAALVVLHHLGLAVVQSDLVFYGGGGFARVLLHAVILIAEAVALIWMTRNTTDLLRLAAQKSDEVETEAETARRNHVVVEQSLAANEARTARMADLQQALGRVVNAAIDGDFSRRLPANFGDDELNRLADSVNNLVVTVENGLSETGDVLAALAERDLTARMTGEHRGAFGRLKENVDAVIGSLSDFVGGLRRTATSLRGATREILSGANDLSERTTKQAATIQETAATMTTLSGAVVENAKRAEQASKMAETVSDTASAGGAVMTKATDAMERITQSSGKISNIIGLIDDIAFQTNLLALNASVEAARAGEAGKGFAVVAIEVRRLAQSAAEASSQVKVLIEQSGNEVANGSKLVAEAAQKLGAMLAAAQQNRELLSRIATENRAQASQIAEVNTAIRTLDEMTQHNAALVEGTNAAIEKTEAQATELDRVVGVFRVAEASAPPLARPIRRTASAPTSKRRVGLTDGTAAIDKDWTDF